MRPTASHVARSVVCVSVCLCVGHTNELCKNCWTDQDAVWGLTDVGLRNHALHGSSHLPREGALLVGDMFRLMVAYPPQANVPAQRAQRTNAFAAARGDKTAMRPFAKLLWTLVAQFIGHSHHVVSYAVQCLTIIVCSGLTKKSSGGRHRGAESAETSTPRLLHGGPQLQWGDSPVPR